MKKLKLEELNRKSIHQYKSHPKTSVCMVLDNIRSMHNVGAVFRTADSFAMEKIILCGITPKPPHREITKTALGATESVDWQYEENITQAIQHLKEKNYMIIGIEQVAESISLEKFSIDITKKYALIVGNEVDGISEEVLPLLDYCIEIPQDGTKHSLNVSVCAGIVLWEFFKHFNR